MSDMAENMKQVKSTENIVAVNKPTLQQAIKQYKKSPFSLFLRVIVTLAAFITVAVLLFLVAYIVVMGVPNLRPSLFELKFTSENASLLPALMFTSGSVADVALNPMDSGRTLAVHMYNLLNEGLAREAAYATAVVLLVLVIGINALSSFVAKKFTKA